MLPRLPVRLHLLFNFLFLFAVNLLPCDDAKRISDAVFQAPNRKKRPGIVAHKRNQVLCTAEDLLIERDIDLLAAVFLLHGKLVELAVQPVQNQLVSNERAHARQDTPDLAEKLLGNPAWANIMGLDSAEEDTDNIRAKGIYQQLILKVLKK